MSTERLIAGVWGDEPPNSVTNVLQVYVSSLRRLVRPVGLEIVRNGAAYCLHGALDDVDVERFQRTAAQGRAALRAHDMEGALESLEQAWTLWDPNPFAGLDECAFAGSARAALLATGLAVATERGTALCGLGRFDEAAAAAELLVDQHPFHEPAWELLMRALYCAGRQHDALAAFGRARTMFVEELGLDPSPSLVALELQILDHALEVPGAGRAVTDVSDPAAGRSRSRLPEPPSGVIGRDEEVLRAIEMLDRGDRLVSLVGLGGMGKTTTALAIGQRLVGAGLAVVFADLSAATEPTAAMAQMCHALDLDGVIDPAECLIEADPDVVLIADNCEQVSALPGAVAALLSSTTRLRILATSRVALGIRMEHVLSIHPLPTASAAGPSAASLLLAARANRIRDTLDLAGDEPEIGAICELAGGIPLAIELAAGRLRSLTPAVLLDRLRRERESILDARGPTDLPDRHHTLRTVVDASAALLSEGATTLARRLSLVKGPVTLELIEQVAADPRTVDHVDDLVGSCLLRGPDSRDRYWMLGPISDYFTPVGDELERSRRCLLSALSAGPDARLLDDSAAVTAACDAALGLHDVASASRLAVMLHRYWLTSGRIGEALKFCSNALALDPIGRDTGAVAALRLVQGQFAAAINRSDGGQLLTEAIAAAEAADGVDELLLLNGWCYLGAWHCNRGELDQARQVAARVDDLSTASTQSAVTALGRDFGAYLAVMVGDFEGAVRLGMESLAVARRGDDRYVLVDVLYRLAESLLVLERVAEADALMDEAMNLALETPIGALATYVLQIKAAVDIEYDRLSSAIGAGLEALQLTTTHFPDPLTRAMTLRILATAWSAAGDIDTAERCVAAAACIVERTGVPMEALRFRPTDVRLDALRTLTEGRSSPHRPLDPDTVVEELLAQHRR